MKTKLFLLLTMLLLIVSQTTYSQCGTCSSSSSIISNNNGIFTASSAQAYFWEICEGSAAINGSNTTQSVSVTCTGNRGFKIKVTRFSDGNCEVACKVALCPSPTPVCNFDLIGINSFINGVPSPLNIIFLNANGNYPNSTTYEWSLTFEKGPPQDFVASTQNPRSFPASINNRVISAKVTARFENCSETETKRFDCPIPDQDRLGNSLCGPNSNINRFDKSIKVFPNPVKSIISFKGNDLENYSITIHDFMGNRIIEDKNLKDNINLGNSKPGIYFYVITGKNNFVQKGRLIKD